MSTIPEDYIASLVSQYISSAVHHAGSWDPFGIQRKLENFFSMSGQKVTPGLKKVIAKKIRAAGKRPAMG